MSTTFINAKSATIVIPAGIQMEAECFVVPNEAYPINIESSQKWEWIHWLQNILRANGQDLLPPEKPGDWENRPSAWDRIEELKKASQQHPLVQLWLTNEKSQDIGSHGIHLCDELGNEHYIKIKEYVPYCLIKDLKEGESMTLRIPAQVEVWSDRKLCTYETLIGCTMTAQQRKYRYRAFGTFEGALHMVCKRYLPTEPETPEVSDPLADAIAAGEKVVDELFGDLLKATEDIK